jgi:formylglycine-generating enzyme required for sulfatase activity
MMVMLMAFGTCAPAWGAEYRDPGTGMEFVFVKGGCFQKWDAAGNKGSGQEVCVDDFYLGKYEVTQGQWQALMGGNPSIFKGCGENCPVESVGWDDAKAFAELLNKKTGRKYRLPYEAEWEYAARSLGKDELWAGTSEEKELKDYAWYGANSGQGPHPVGRKQPNSLGLYDMSGNVWEWMEDKLVERVKAGSLPEREVSWEFYLLRGGSWDDTPGGLRFAPKNLSRVIETELSLGFRLALPLR